VQFPSLVLNTSIEYLVSFSSQLGGPFDFCAFASLSELLLGSLVIALKCTRPRQRFMYVVGRYSMTEGGMCQEGETNFVKLPN
jgi:hypothetical protein